tara:strand:+ start:119 stop:346 length:228 start_codon:yes stop_codon:yes gene_type:complete
MSGHNAVFNLGEQQQGTPFDGKFLIAQSGAPSNTTDTGFGKGALYIRTDGSSNTTTWYVNIGTAAVPNWDALTIA